MSEPNTSKEWWWADGGRDVLHWPTDDGDEWVGGDEERDYVEIELFGGTELVLL
jgi:hypothetical protein